MALSLEQILDLTKRSIKATEGTGSSPTSTAVGDFQFTANKWLTTQYSKNPALFGSYNAITIANNPVLRSNILNMRLDPVETNSAMDYLLTQYVTQLTNASVDVSPGALYACFLFGTTKGILVYTTSADQYVTDVLDQQSINLARGYVYNTDGSSKTISQLQALLEKYATIANQKSTNYTQSKQNTPVQGVKGRGMSNLENIAFAGLMQSSGLGINSGLLTNINLLESTHITGIMCKVMTQVGNALSGVGSNELSMQSNDIIIGVINTLSTLSNNQCSFLTSVVPASLNQLYDDKLHESVKDVTQPLDTLIENPLSLVNVMQESVVHGGLPGLLRKIAKNTVNPSDIDLSSFITVMTTVNNFNKIAMTNVAATSEAMSQSFGNGPGGLGANFRNMNDVISFGISAISRDMNGAAKNFVDMGTWDLVNLFNLHTSGSVVSQLVKRGLSTKLGLVKALIDIQVPVGDLENPSYTTSLQNLLQSITDPVALAAVQTEFNMFTKLSNLGQLTDIAYMLPAVAQHAGYANFPDLGKHFITLGLTKTTNFQELGYVLSQVDPGTDLNHLSQLGTPMHLPSGDFTINHYGFGGGVFGELTMVDFIGTAAGYIHNDSLPYIIHANDMLYQMSEGVELSTRVSKLLKLILGNYNSGGNYVVPGLGTFTDIVSAINAVCASIKQQIDIVAAIPAGTGTGSAIAAAEKAHVASYSQIIKEALHMRKIGLSFYVDQGKGKTQQYQIFVASLNSIGGENGYGQLGEYLEHVTTDDIYGDAIKAILKQGRNSKILRDMGINTDMFVSPKSKYYTDPTAMYNQVYSGNMPVVPANQQDPLLPLSEDDAYIENRNALLIKNGHNPYSMPSAQADETYMNLNASTMGFDTREQIGLDIVRQTLVRNMQIVGNQLFITQMDGTTVVVADINQNGLVINNQTNLITILYHLTSKTIYGNLPVSNSTPYLTDKMIYGVLDMLKDISPAKMEKLKNTLLGKYAMIDLLENIQTVMMELSGAMDTSMDRNVPQTWGDAGPGSDITLS